MLTFGKASARFIEKPLIGLSKTVFSKANTQVEKFLNPNLPKGQQFLKRTTFSTEIPLYAGVDHVDLSYANGKKVLQAFDRNGEVVAEGINGIRELMDRGLRIANRKFYGTAYPKFK